MNWKIIFLFINLSLISCDDNIEKMKQMCMMNFPNNQKCNNAISGLADYKCCTVETRINAYVNTFCSFLQWKLKDSLDEEKNRLKRLYNAKSIKIDCKGNYLHVSFIIIFLGIIFL